jgi:hypothetical protein
VPRALTRWESASVVALLLVALAAAAGASLGVRERPTPSPVAATASPAPAPTPIDPAEALRRAFAQPLAAGCATGSAVWVFADGGSPIRFDGRLWTIPDPTLRSLDAAACREGMAIAVGGAGSIVTVDDALRTVHVDRSGIDDLHALVLLPDGALAVGSRGTILRQTAVDWGSVQSGISADLYGVAASERTAWVVGAGGAAYRLAGSTWSTSATGTTSTLRSVVAPSPDTAIAAGDGGTLLRWTSAAWTPLPSGTSGALRSAALVGASVWVVGDAGTALALEGTEVRRVDLGTKCTLRAVFSEGSAVWVIGSDDLRGAAWRVTPNGVDRWGSC